MAGAPEQGIWKGIKKGENKISREILPKAPSSRLRLVNQSAAKICGESPNPKQSYKRSLSEELKETLEKDKKKLREIDGKSIVQNDAVRKDESKDPQRNNSLNGKTENIQLTKEKPRIISDLEVSKKVRAEIIQLDKLTEANEHNDISTNEKMEIDDMVEKDPIMADNEGKNKKDKEYKLKPKVHSIKDNNSKQTIINKFEIVLKDNDKINKFSKRHNMLRILHFLRHGGSGVSKIRMLTARKAEATTDYNTNAEELIKEINNKGKDNIMAYIPNRLKERWGVIAEWPYSMEELLEEVDPLQGEYTLERMKKKINIDGETQWTESKAIMIKYKGPNLPTKLWVYGGKFGLKITPYMTSIKQCTRCFKYGHRRPNCIAEQPACFVCGEAFHGLCTNRPKCINCHEPHNASDSKCTQRQLEVLANRLVAYRNLPYPEARKAAEEELGIKKRLIKEFKKGNIKEYDTEEEDPNLPSHLDGDLFPAMERHRRNIRRKMEYWENKPIPEDKFTRVISKNGPAWKANHPAKPAEPTPPKEQLRLVNPPKQNIKEEFETHKTDARGKKDNTNERSSTIEERMEKIAIETRKNYKEKTKSEPESEQRIEAIMKLLEKYKMENKIIECIEEKKKRNTNKPRSPSPRRMDEESGNNPGPSYLESPLRLPIRPSTNNPRTQQPPNSEKNRYTSYVKKIMDKRERNNKKEEEEDETRKKDSNINNDIKDLQRPGKEEENSKETETEMETTGSPMSEEEAEGESPGTQEPGRDGH